MSLKKVNRQIQRSAINLTAKFPFTTFTIFSIGVNLTLYHNPSAKTSLLSEVRFGEKTPNLPFGHHRQPQIDTASPNHQKMVKTTPRIADHTQLTNPQNANEIFSFPNTEKFSPNQSYYYTV